jgi:predicted 3-demethylubiquinone-9 3-methyltransferase (glyoxalase superfamily)
MANVNTYLNFKNVIYPCLWFDGNAREAADFYCSVFKGSKVKSENQLVVIFEAADQKFMLLNGGPMYKINPSVSFFVVCKDENEIDEAWQKLLEEGKVLMPLDNYPWSKKYGWIQDRFGVNWQLSFSAPDVVSQKFTPALLFTGDQCGRAEEAINYYISLFEDSSVLLVSKYSGEENEIAGNINHAQFKLRNRIFMAMDSSRMHNFSFNEGVSFVVECDDQKEIDHFWNNLTEGGEESQCGWLKDRFGVSWQIIPSILDKLMSDPEKSKGVINAFLKMRKFEIDKLLEA